MELKAYLKTCWIYPVSLFVFQSCTSKKTELVWDQSFPVLGSQSSPRAADLNQDGVLDIVIGAGKNEYQESDQGILALDGSTGAVLWQQSAPDQVFGTPTFSDINGDGVQDVFIGGRSPHFKALDGKTGAVIWAYQHRYEADPILRYAKRNFYNSRLVPDQNADGLPDLLVQNGGNPKVAPSDTTGRDPGVLLLLDSKTGAILAADTMPDGGESYMSPLYFRQTDGQDDLILFGTGGETLDGSLYLAKLSDLKAGRLSQATRIASEEGHGFIAPPVLVDLNQDGKLDIAAISHGSSIFAIDGATLKPIWQKRIAGTECSNSFAVGYFTDDDTPDLFTFVSKGVWPNSTGSLQLLLDGRDGAVVYRDSIGCTGFSSPVVYDLNGDGRDEAIISINEFDCAKGFVEQSSRSIVNKLLYIDFANKATGLIDQLSGFKNIFTTPWIGDLDEDGYLDIVYGQYYNPTADLMAFLGMRMKRISTSVKMKQPVLWGAYMGSEGNGIFSD